MCTVLTNQHMIQVKLLSICAWDPTDMVFRITLFDRKQIMNAIGHSVLWRRVKNHHVGRERASSTTRLRPHSRPLNLGLRALPGGGEETMMIYWEPWRSIRWMVRSLPEEALLCSQRGLGYRAGSTEGPDTMVAQTLNVNMGSAVARVWLFGSPERSPARNYVLLTCRPCTFTVRCSHICNVIADALLGGQHRISDFWGF